MGFKKLLVCIILPSQALAWGGDSGVVNRVWSNGWDNKADQFCFEIIRSDGESQLYGVREGASIENKNRIFSIVLAAQMSSKKLSCSIIRTIQIQPALIAK